jgi:shikimate kinase
VIQRVVLLGYMCSGKSTVAESLARRLGWRFLDFDVVIEEREGAAVRDIVEARGEEYLRELERRLTEELSPATGVVAAPGGGWITQPELLHALGPETMSFWLSVTAEETVRRLREDSIDRPLKDHPDPVPLVSEMLDEREPLYRRADVRVPTDGRTVEEIAFEIELLLRTRGCHR